MDLDDLRYVDREVDGLPVVEAYEELEPYLDDVHTALQDEMKEVAGGELVEWMYDVFGSEDDAVDWFYSTIPALGGERPYTYCVEGEEDAVENVLASIEYGMPA